MKTIILVAATLHLVLGASVIDVMCPNSCSCQIKDDDYEISCSSYEFIKKLMQKQTSTTVRLNIQNSTITTVDSKLKFLKNLKFLDLSNNTIANLPVEFPYLPKLKSLNLSRNHLKEANFRNLPKNLEVVDFSKNFIAYFPKDWASLKQLKTVYFHDNPIDCDCSNLIIHEQMLLGGISFSENLTCRDHKDFYDKPINSVNCPVTQDNLLDTMLGDEGSGEPETENISNNFSVFDETESFFRTDSAEAQAEDHLTEGSGEGSGDDLIPILPIPACHINCSTPKPLGADDEHDASPPPNFNDRVNIIMDDLNDIIGNGKEESKNETVKQNSDADRIVKEESIIAKETDKSQVETFPTNDTVVGEMERASIQDSNSQTAYIVVGLILAFLVFMTIYYINRKKNNNRKNNRKRNKPNENGFGEEMKPMGKSAEKEALSLETPKPVTAEVIPLLNGQNGKIVDDNPTTLPLLLEIEITREDDVELRQPTDEELLTPPVQRVTIKAAEIPDSIPKTPLFVHRQKDSDGNITESVY